MNSRLKNTLGEVHLKVDPHKAPNVIKDFEGTSLIEGTGELDKSDLTFTHLTDAIGYYIEKRFPVKERRGGYKEI
jgi:hypothetical protein